MSSAAVIIQDATQRVLLLQRGADAPWMPLRWDLPGGMIEKGESPEYAAIREALEETALTVSDLVPITTVKTKGGPHHIFFAWRWSGRVKINYEHLSYSWVPRKDLPAWDLVPPQRPTLELLSQGKVA